ncbi:hypothetical protein D3C81_1668480 [compost metagenome]|uniref:hypothetical protein n=1 Tax=unclassified Pseudomonas TaxID=196821 RepID=UPI000BA3C5A8|nr:MULTISPECIES: hypothetical protein [unclassified Pseudomonas]
MIDLSFVNGTISHDGLSLLLDGDLSAQLLDLKEDMLQVEYSSSFLLDVGWYPSFDLDGRSQIRVVKDYDWSDLLFFFGSDHSFFAKKGNG